MHLWPKKLLDLSPFIFVASQDKKIHQNILKNETNDIKYDCVFVLYFYCNRCVTHTRLRAVTRNAVITWADTPPHRLTGLLD